MGSYPSAVLGIFLRVPITSKPVVSKVRRKSNGKITQNKFNPETGEEYTLFTETKIEPNDPSPYITDNDALGEDTFWKPSCIEEPKGYKIFILNGSESESLDTDGFTLSLEHINYDKKINPSQEA